MNEQELEGGIDDEVWQCEQENDAHDEHTAAAVVPLNAAQIRDTERREQDQEVSAPTRSAGSARSARNRATPLEPTTVAITSVSNVSANQ
jgi:hypothetical protein